MQGPVQREKYEWANVWWDCADDTTLPRVLLIGDSISCGYSAVVTRLLAGTVHVDRMGTSRSINDPVLVKETALMLEDCKYKVIHFNNGLHGFHLSGPDYAASLQAYVDLLRRLGGEAKLVWGSSTPITVNGDVNTLAESNAVVLERNALAAGLMGELGILVNDLYATVAGKPELRSTDGYHYNGDGYEALGKAVADAVRAALE